MTLSIVGHTAAGAVAPPVTPPGRQLVPATIERLFVSGHSLTDPPLPEYLAMVAGSLGLALQWNLQSIAGSPIRDCVAAISVGVVGRRAVLDLDYEEDSKAEVDMNIVMTGAGAFVEVQGTAEQTPFDQARLQELIALSGAGIGELVALQRRALGARGETVFTL